MWNGEQLDLDLYLKHLGYDGDRAPTLETLRAVHRAHVLSVRWENLDGFLHQEVALDVPTLQDKLLRRGRGGYCYEHVQLLAAALERLGFRFTAVSGRVQMGSPTIRPATHSMLIVHLDGRRWLTDVGFGSSPLAPIELLDGDDGNQVVTDNWPYLLRRDEVTPGADGWTLYQPGEGEAPTPAGVPEGWMARHTFTLNPQYPVDFQVGNHFVASNSHSPFIKRPFIQRVLPERLDQLDGLTWTTFRPSGSGEVPPEVREVRAREVPQLLGDVFGIELTAPEAESLLARIG